MEFVDTVAKGRRPCADDSLLDESLTLNGRYIHLDVTRICCVICVVIGLFDDRHFEWNTLYAQNWVLQLSWLISGVCFCLTKRPLYIYLRRLLTYLAMGIAINIAAWMINDWDMGPDIWFVFHQMNYVLALFWICIMLAPLKAYLVTLAEEAKSESLPEEAPEDGGRRRCSLQQLQGSVWLTSLILVGGVVVIFAVFSLVINRALGSLCAYMSQQGVTLGYRSMGSTTRAAMLGVDMGHCLQIIFSGLWIVLAFPRLSKNYALVTWLLLANLYGHRLVVGYGRADFPFSGFYLVMVALTAYHLGLSYRRQIGKLVHRYWMVVIFLLRFFCTPGLHGALISHPPEIVYDRERYVLVEALFIVAWLTAGQHMVDPAIFTDDRLGWVNLWALAIFPLASGSYWLFRAPISWMVLIAVGPICWLCHQDLVPA